jgi:FkbM family methyltransferase
VNEIFCRRDYGGRAHRTVVDIGANVGLASLFFLTRSPDARVWAYEPDPANVQRLRETLTGFEERYTLVEAAVTVDETPSVRFVTGGRYGHLAGEGEGGVDVPAVAIARALREVVGATGSIDLVKIDTEGTDEQLAAAVPADSRIAEVRYEDNRGRVIVRRR